MEIQNRDERDLGDGNNKHPPSEKKQSLQLIKWCFTFNNYLKEDIEILDTKFKEICKKYVFQEEVGEKTKTPHLQGAIWLKKKMRWTEFELNKKIHWSGMRNEERSIKYCQKSETAVGEPHIYGFPKPIKTLTELKPWQQAIETLLLTTEPDGRTVHWYWDKKGGVGKSAFCKYMFIKHGALVIQGGKLADIMNIIFNANMDNITTIIIDIPRSKGNKVSYSAVECILNGMITNTKYETGAKVFNPPHVIIFSNYKPDVEELSDDRWIITNIGANKK